jgi:hypothetical protein
LLGGKKKYYDHPVLPISSLHVGYDKFLLFEEGYGAARLAAAGGNGFVEQEVYFVGQGVGFLFG